MIEHRLPLPPGPPVLALGAWFKNTVCATSRTEAVLSHTVGDLAAPEACRSHEHTAAVLLDWLRQAEPAGPALIAHDLHPDFHSSRHAAVLAAELDEPLLPVQHHHAHIAAVCAEHGHHGPVLGLALDGVGHGTDGTAWGGELLWVHGSHSQRLGHLAPLPLPGGDRAAHEPWRMAAAVLHACGLGDRIATRFADQPAAASLAALLDSGLRCPPSSSLGRLFDAAAGLLGLCRVMQHDAEAPIALERAATQHGPCPPMESGWNIDASNRLHLLPVLASLIDEPDAGRGAARFHATLGQALAAWVVQAAQQHGVSTVAAGGGCLFNRLLSADLAHRLSTAGVRLLLPRQLPPGDSAIAFGQAVVARHHLQEN